MQNAVALPSLAVTRRSNKYGIAPYTIQPSSRALSLAICQARARNAARVELARDHDFPDGSSERGYEFTAPLTNDGRISESEWKANRTRCRVRRFWSGDAGEVGHLIRKPGGSWAFHYDLLGDPDDDESGSLWQSPVCPWRIRFDQGA